ncbi:MAG: hypothetical protein D6794_02575 [Deltaproteobacteria bacterium]|nr:MAG: hypothetical protein D6794_02575 [Deltaproteobacteria bacterium]
MFRLDEKRTRLGIPARQVVRLEQSHGDAQVSVPGFPSQMARAYLCVFQVQGGLRITVVLHLLASNHLAFFFNPEGGLDKESANRSLGEAIRFAESLGFLMANLDFHRLDAGQREQLWRSLPLARGLSGGSEPAAGKAGKPEPAAATGAENGAAVWTVEQMQQKRRRFIENLGRLLAML